VESGEGRSGRLGGAMALVQRACSGRKPAADDKIVCATSAGIHPENIETPVSDISHFSGGADDRFVSSAWANLAGRPQTPMVRPTKYIPDLVRNPG
jgi:hypothetical protein